MKRVAKFKFDFLSIPTLREIERWFVVVLGRALINAGKVRERGNFLTVLFVAAHGSIRKPKREGRIRITARAFNGKTRFRDF